MFLITNEKSILNLIEKLLFFGTRHSADPTLGARDSLDFRRRDSDPQR